MMLFWKKAPSPGPAGRPLPQRERWGTASLTSPLGERSAATPPGEGAFSEHNSPIWNDIQRALDGAGK